MHAIHSSSSMQAVGAQSSPVTLVPGDGVSSKPREIVPEAVGPGVTASATGGADVTIAAGAAVGGPTTAATGAEVAAVATGAAVRGLATTATGADVTGTVGAGGTVGGPTTTATGADVVAVATGAAVRGLTTTATGADVTAAGAGVRGAAVGGLATTLDTRISTCTGEESKQGYVRYGRRSPSLSCAVGGKYPNKRACTGWHQFGEYQASIRHASPTL